MAIVACIHCSCNILSQIYLAKPILLMFEWQSVYFFIAAYSKRLLRCAVPTEREPSFGVIASPPRRAKQSQIKNTLPEYMYHYE